MPSLTQVAKSLVGPRAGPSTTRIQADNAVTILALADYAKEQRLRIYLLAALMAFILAAPFIIILLDAPATYLPYLFAGSGIFGTGTLVLFAKILHDHNTAQTLVVLCQGLNTVDAREVIQTWLNRH